MASFLNGAQLRLLAQGYTLSKSVTLQTSAATNTLFTVTGGAVMVTAMLGLVTTLIGSTATTLALGTAPTTGTAKTAGIATATAITSAEVGTWVTPTNNTSTPGVAGALSVGSNAGASAFLGNPGFIVTTGTITSTTSANAGGGVFTWYLQWVPLDTGASVA